MYSEWTSLTAFFQNGNEERYSVLDKFPANTGKDVVVAVVKPLAANLGITQASEPSVLSTDREVRWNMEVRNQAQHQRLYSLTVHRRAHCQEFFSRQGTSLQ